MTQNPNIVLFNKQQSTLGTCQQCEFMQSCKLSQQIVQLREKLIFYQNKNKQIEAFLQKDQQQKCKALQCYKNVLEQQIGCIDDEQNEIQRLQKQLQQLERQLQKEKTQQQTQRFQQQQFIKQLIQIQNYQFQSQKEYQKLLQHLDNLQRKQIKLNKLKSLFQKTNFINIIYSISFEDGDSFMNGEKIVPQNSWKVIEILAFYQQKYPQYRPLFKIDWNKMQIIPQQQKIQESSHIDIMQSLPIQISCNNASDILQTWMQSIVLEMKNLFQFIVKQSGMNSKLKYQVTNQGQFQFVKSKIFKNQNQMFNVIIKCLLNDIDQINQLQFFAKQKRIKENFQKEK